MTTSRVNHAEIVAALLVGAIGLMMVWVGSDYIFGTPRRIGPGFLPVVVGCLIILLSAALVVEAVRTEPSPLGIELHPFLLVMLSIPAFAVLVERAGLVPATASLVMLSVLAERPVRPVRALVLAVLISAMGVAIFVYALGLPLRAIRW